MPRECVLNLNHVDTVAKGFIGHRITTLSAEKLHSVCVPWMSPPATDESRVPSGR